MDGDAMNAAQPGEAFTEDDLEDIIGSVYTDGRARDDVDARSPAISLLPVAISRCSVTIKRAVPRYRELAASSRYSIAISWSRHVGASADCDITSRANGWRVAISRISEIT